MKKLQYRVRQNGTTGKSKNPVYPFAQKYPPFAVGQIKGMTPRVSPTEGRAHVTNAGWDAVDAEAATDECG